MQGSIKILTSIGAPVSSGSFNIFKFSNKLPIVVVGLMLGDTFSFDNFGEWERDKMFIPGHNEMTSLLGIFGNKPTEWYERVNRRNFITGEFEVWVNTVYVGGRNACVLAVYELNRSEVEQVLRIAS